MLTVSSAAEWLQVALSTDASVISVDLFDTLLYRCCRRPRAVFAIQHRDIAQLLPGQMPAEDWARLRRDSEKQLAKAAAPYEITLQDIYGEIGRRTGLPENVWNALMAAELAAEDSVIRPYPEMIRALQTIAAHKQICITTDSYLPESFLRGVLGRYLSCRFDLRCSSATDCPKRSGLAYPALKAAYPGARILHCGDNPVSDIRRARENGVPACLVRHARQAWLRRTSLQQDYLQALGIYRYPTPFDAGGAGAKPRDLMAWQWAIVLADVLRAADAEARRIKADEIWMLSRDCETMFEVTQTQSSLFTGIPVKYISASREASYPILAAREPDTFRRICRRAPTAEDRETGETLCAAYQARRDPASRTILILDAGWKSRIQYALQKALPDCDVHGFYFSLEDPDVPHMAGRTTCFMPWDPSCIRKSAVEVLAGFVGDSCSGYQKTAQGYAPQFRTSDGDKSPAEYKRSLAAFLTAFLQEMHPQADAATARLRRRLIRSMMIFPCRDLAGALKGWTATTDAKGLRISEICNSATLLGKDKNNCRIWPTAAIWSSPGASVTARIYQTYYWLNKYLRSRLHCTPGR